MNSRKIDESRVLPFDTGTMHNLHWTDGPEFEGRISISMNRTSGVGRQ